MSTIDRNQLTAYQKTVYDQWLTVPGHTAEDEELVEILGFIQQPKTRIRHAKRERDENVRREAELVLRHLELGIVPKITICKQCGESFATDYLYNRHCSDDCLRKALLDMGLKWNPEKTPAERWQTAQIPSMIEPESLKKLTPVFEARAAAMPIKGEQLTLMVDLDDPFANI